MRDPVDRVEASSPRVVAASRWLPRTPGTTRAVPLVVSIVAVTWALQWARPVLLPLAAAILFALLLYPLVARLRRLRVSHGLAALLAILFVLGGIGLVVDLTIEPARDWLDRAPRLLRDVEDRVKPLRLVLDKVESVTHQAERVTTGNGRGAVQVVKAAPESASRSFLVATQAFAISLVTIVVLTYFLLATRPTQLARAVGAVGGPHAARRVLVVFAALRVELGRYFATIALINVGLGLATAGAMALLGMPNPALWGAVAATLNFVPYIGSAVTLCVLTVVALVTFDTLGPVFAVAGTYLLLTTIEGQFVQPIAVGRRLAVSPLIVIIALMFWGWLWGIAGVALAVPLVLSAKAVCTHVRAWRPIAEAMTPSPRWSPAPRGRMVEAVLGRRRGSRPPSAPGPRPTGTMLQGSMDKDRPP